MPIEKMELEEKLAANEIIGIERSSQEEAGKEICHWKVEPNNPLHNMQEGNSTYGADQDSTQLATWRR